ncbi:VOC family protein [Micromonospora olivasterospora]|uniref:Putative enzyme related to lactoylglutathione lyase n=1 Tax=Micromonospora olivasterospora TaxID=1880 RepID=A0A562I958_MICOL|nr:VOC family protein [Micromonospora olivasterospora]TWH67570.1 putative enzyme related to lactoylglutathione lyase [Micromonospora olivasterospora]
MTHRPRLALATTVLDAPDAQELAAFYERLLGWSREQDEPHWVVLRPPGGGTGLSFQTEPAYVRPVWPGGPHEPRLMAHLDIEVDDLDVASAHAVAAGATVADFQPQEDVRVHFDPAGHPFCLFVES